MEPITLTSTDLVGLDPGLLEAVGEATQQMSMMPIIKNELKNKILLQRHRSGMGDIDVDEKRPKIKRELTEEEVHKKQRRKEQNRRAATRCRKKKKCLESKVQSDYFREQQRTAALEKEINQLKQDRAHLQRVLDEHSATCMRSHVPSPQSTSFDDMAGSVFDGQQMDQYGRDTHTPGDPFDDQVVGTNCRMYPSPPQHFTCKPEPGVHIPEASCTATLEYSDADLPAELRDFSAGFFQPYSPDLVLGRQSISDYLDEPEQQFLDFNGL